MNRTPRPVLLGAIAFFSVFFLLRPAHATEPLRIYTAGDPAFIDKLLAGFKEDTGETVEYVRLSSGEAVTRMRTEAKNPKASAFMIGPGIEYAFAADQGLFEPYQPKIDHEIAEKYRDKNWRWHGLYLGATAFGTNKKFLAEKKLSAPTSWDELLKPEYKGKISYAYPYTSGTALTILLGLVKLKGEAGAFEYIKKLDGQVFQYTKSGSACVNQVGLGEVAVCIAFAHDILSKGVDKGYPVELTFPKEGTSYESTGAALIKGGPDLERAKKLIDWAHGVKGQTILESWHTTPFNPKVKVRPPGIPVTQLKVVEIEPDWAAKNQKALVEKWRRVTGK